MKKSYVYVLLTEEIHSGEERPQSQGSNSVQL
jgi:hypothetical protein